MKLSIDIKSSSSPEWIQAVMNDFESFLKIPVVQLAHLVDCVVHYKKTQVDLVKRFPTDIWS